MDTSYTIYKFCTFSFAVLQKVKRRVSVPTTKQASQSCEIGNNNGRILVYWHLINLTSPTLL